MYNNQNIIASYLKTVIKEFLGKFGNEADIENLMQSYKYAQTDLEKAEILVFIERIEKGKKNNFYAQKQNDSDFIKETIAWLKSK